MKNRTTYSCNGNRIPGTTFVNGKHIVWAVVGIQILDDNNFDWRRRHFIPQTFERLGGDFALIKRIHGNGDFLGKWLIPGLRNGNDPKELLFSRGGVRHLVKREVRHLLNSGLLAEEELNIVTEVEIERLTA